MLFRNRLPEEVTDPQIDGILTVETEPCQVSYYLSALQYLKYLGQNKKLTERALKLQNSKSELVSDIYNQLLEDKLFGKAYHDFKATGQVNIDKVASDLKKESQRLSESTLRRYEALVFDSLSKAGIEPYYFSKNSGLEIGFVIAYHGYATLLEAKATTGNTKASKTVMKHPEHYGKTKLIKIGDYNISETDDIITIPHYLTFALGKTKYDF